MAAVGRIKCPISVVLFKPPHFPRNRTPFGLTDVKRSMMVAVARTSNSKFMILRPSELIEEVIGPPIPLIFEPNLSENFST